MTTYTKSIASDFGGNLDTSQLQTEIKSNGVITTPILRIDTNGDQVFIVFSDVLSNTEETALNTLITAHVPAIKYTESMAIHTRSAFYVKTTYEDIATYIYNGSNTKGILKQILAVAYKDAAVTNYSIRIYNETNNTVIAEGTFTNSTKQMVNLTPLSNIPTTPSVFTVQAKKTGGTTKQYFYVELVEFRI